jgi:hypothetical protein
VVVAALALFLVSLLGLAFRRRGGAEPPARAAQKGG